MLMLGRCVVWIPARGVIGHVQNCTDFGNDAANCRFDSLPQRLCGLPATLAAASHPNEDIVLTDVDQLHPHRRVKQPKD